MSELSEYYILKKNQGWYAILSRQPDALTEYGTKRVAKLMKVNQYQITIGATQQGLSRNLNAKIEQIITSSGLRLEMAKSTSGSRGYETKYPAFTTEDPTQAVRILLYVEGIAVAG